MELKEEAKGLLLKGCYKMASNKYKQLIERGSEGFGQRDWAVVHLNTGICLQFQEKYQEALQYVNRALQIDPKYEKAHYRRVQVLRELGAYEEALNCTPHWIANKEIEQLKSEIREEFMSSLGLDQVIDQLMKAKQSPHQVKQAHSQFYQRLTQHLDQKQNTENIRKLGNKITQYYYVLVEQEQKASIESFCELVHLLLVKNKQKPNPQVSALLQPFWSSFFTHSSAVKAKRVLPEDMKTKQEFKVIKYAPVCEQSLEFLKVSMLGSDIQSNQIFESCIQMASNFQTQSSPSEDYLKLLEIVHLFLTTLAEQLAHQTVGWFKRALLLIDSLVRTHMKLWPHFEFANVDLTSVTYLRYYLLSGGSANFHKVKMFKNIRSEILVEYLESNLQNFAVIFIAEQFIHKLDRTLIKGMIPALEDQLSFIRDLQDINKHSPKDSRTKILSMRRQYELVYTSLMLKIDLKHSVERVDMTSLLAHKNNTKQLSKSLSDLALNTFLLLSISNKQHLLEVLNNPATITELVQQFLQSPIAEQVERVSLVLNLVYILGADVEHLQEEEYAHKMGVNVKEIEKARRIQKEGGDDKVKEELAKRRQKFRQYASAHWHQIVPELCMLLLKLSEEGCLGKLSQFLSDLSQIDCSRFAHPKIIEVMLLAFKTHPSPVGKFFCKLCKGINPELLKFEVNQSIANVLEFNVTKAEHELIMFESLLGLINLTSNTSIRFKVSVSVLVDCLLQQNMYIVHAACELLNNIMVHEEREEVKQLPKIMEIVTKYMAFFRETVKEEAAVKLTDYSHPCKIYATLISLAIVLDMEDLPQFKDWPSMEACLLSIKGPKPATVFKTVIYMKSKRRIQGKWWGKFEPDLSLLKQQDKPRWLKLQQYMQ